MTRTLRSRRSHARLALPFLPLFLYATAAGCSSGSSSGDEATAGLTVSITDAASDELASFVVDVTAVELERPGGAVVGVLADGITVDLVTLEETSQVLNVLNVPPGVYADARVTLDFQNASVFLIDETTAATILDDDGMPLAGEVTLPIRIGNALTAREGRHRILELDFDLDQSVSVDAGTNSVFVEPTIVMRVDRNDPKDLAFGGELASIDTIAGTFELEIRSPRRVRIGTFVVAVDANTVYQVDGVPARGAAGLAALAAKPNGTWVQGFGAIDPAETRILAAYVEAGAGTFNGSADFVEGHVIGRSGGAGADPVLAVLGFSADRTGANRNFNAVFSVAASLLNTKVVARGSRGPLDTDAINVGQRIRAYGTLSGFNLDARTSNDVIRLQPTHVLGIATGAVARGVLNVDVERIGRRPASRFLWSEGGTTPPDPDAMSVLVGGFGSGLGITSGSAIDARGFFAAVDDADEDVVASSLTNLDSTSTLLIVRDRVGGLSVVPSVGPLAFVLTIAGSPGLGERADVSSPLRGTLPLPTAPQPSIVPTMPLGVGLFSIRDRSNGRSALYFSYDGFSSALDFLLSIGGRLRNVQALGRYDAGINTLQANVVTVTVD